MTRSHARSTSDGRLAVLRPLLATALLAAALLAALLAAPAAQAQVFKESFAEVTAPGWTLLGDAQLTAGGIDAAGAGWLRLTSALGYQAGGAVTDGTFDPGGGFVLTFDYADWGGVGGLGGDGFAVFLLDGATAAPTLGATGGGLGYSAYYDTPPAYCPTEAMTVAQPGVTGGWLGIGFDEYGDFTQCWSGYGHAMPDGFTPNSVALRGSGTAAPVGSLQAAYRELAQVALGSVRAGAAVDGVLRSVARAVRVTLLGTQIAVEMDLGAGLVEVLPAYDLATATGQAPMPATMKLGFSGATGFFGNLHEIRGAVLQRPTLVTVGQQVAPASTAVGGTVTFQVGLVNDALYPVIGATLTDAFPAGLTGVTWTAAVTGGATVERPSGAGNLSETVNLPRGASVLYTVTATATAAAVGQDLLNTALFTPPSGFVNLYAASAQASLGVSQAATATVVVAAPGAPAAGQPVTLTATVSALPPGGGVPGGTVTFLDGAAILGTGALGTGGTATVVVPALGVGSHTITASYPGSAGYGASASPGLAVGVGKAATTTDLSADVTAPVYGQAVTLTAAVVVTPPGTGTPAGTVTFSDGATGLGTGTLDTAGLATVTTSALAVGSHSITATWAGSAALGGSTSAPVVLSVSRASTSTALAATPDPSAFGQAVTLTATVAAVSPGAGTPTGTVTFLDGSTSLGTGTLNAVGVATLTTSALAVGTHSITAAYGAGTNHAASTSLPVSQAVGQASTTTTLAASPNPSVFRQAVTLTATVVAGSPGGSAPAGTVTFLDGTTTLGSGALNAAGVATLTTSALTVGSHSITASYGASASHAASTSSAVAQVVARAATSTALAATPDPSVYGQAVTLTATVAAVSPGGGTPAGTVTFLAGATSLGTGTLNASGVATLATSALAVGSYSVTARYGVSASHAASTSTAVAQVVALASTTTSLAVSPNPSVYGQAVTLTATVAAVSPGGGTPSGTVTFHDGATTLGTGTVGAAGVATLVTTDLAVATHALTASYAASASHAASTSSPVGAVVGKASTGVSLASSRSPTLVGQTVTLTADVVVLTPGAGTPTGTVTFSDGATSLGAAALDASGVATLTTAALPLGLRALTAGYGGADSFAASTSAALQQAVVSAATTTTLAVTIDPPTYGQPATLTATVAPVAPATGTPGGTVIFFDGSATLGTAAVGADGQAVLALGSLAAGSHAMAASYVGSTSYGASNSLPVVKVVAKAASVLSMTATPTPANRGSPVTISVTVATAGAAPTGSVTFLDGARTLGVVALDASGHSTLLVDNLVVGVHPLSATWPGDDNHLGASDQASVTVVVPTSLQVAVTSSRNPSRTGRPVTLTATVTGPGSTPPAGTVTFLDGAITLGAVALLDGKAQLSTRALAKGNHAITVSYPVDSVAVIGVLTDGEVVENSPPVALAGTALRFGGSTAPASASSAAVDASGGALDTTEGTVEAWVRTGWSAAGEVGATPEVASLGAAGALRWSLGVAPDRAHAVVSAGGAQVILPAALGDGAWHHLALVAQGGATTLLVDGVAAGEAPANFGTSASGTATSTALWLGKGFLGFIDEVRIWSTARSAETLRADAKRPLRGDEAGLLGLWHLDEGVGLEIFDAAAGHLDGEVTLVAAGNERPAAFAPSDAWSSRSTRSGLALDPVAAGYDPDGDALQLAVTQPAAHGNGSASGLTLGYRSEKGWTGTDTFGFTLDDGTDQEGATLTVVVDRAVVCQQDADCGGGELCASGICQSTKSAHLAGGCGTTGSAGSLAPWALLAIGLAWRRRRGTADGAGRRVDRRLPVALALLLSAGAARAQTARPFALQTYQPPPAGDLFLVVPDAAAPGHLVAAAALTAGLATDPLALELDGTVASDGHLVRRAAWGHAQASLGLGSRLLLGVTAPVALSQSGQASLSSLPPVAASGLGDLSVMGRFTLHERPGLRLAASGELYLPTGARAAYAGDGTVRGHASAIAGGEVGVWRYGTALGLLWRPSRDLVATRIGPALTWSGAVAWRRGAFTIGPELYGRYQPSGRATSPLEALLGAGWSSGPWQLSAGLGAALDRAVGAAAMRAVLRVAWRQPAPAGVPRRSDRDGDGVPDDLDACPDLAGPASVEAASNGCPLPAPPPPEAVPPPAPSAKPGRGGPRPQRETPRELPPEPPRVQAPPALPAAEPPSATTGEVPRQPAVRLTGEKVELLRPVQFVEGGEALQPDSEAVLREAAAVLQAHPELARIRVEGHTDARGIPAQNLELSARRAAAVRRWLVEKGGVAPGRLTAEGFGATQPVASNLTIQGRAANRRVELRIMEKVR